MQETTVAELRKHTKRYFDAVELGDIIRVYRRGRPVAEIVPISPEEPAWKNASPLEQVIDLLRSIVTNK